VTASLKNFFGVEILSPEVFSETAKTRKFEDEKIGLGSLWRAKIFKQKEPFYPFFFCLQAQLFQLLSPCVL
jgi:hypothetical protein